MATANVTEYSRIGGDEDGHTIQIPFEPALVTQTAVTYTTAALSSAFGADTKYVCFIASAKAHFSFGAAPTATANSLYTPADTVVCRAVIPGQKVSFYDGTS